MPEIFMILINILKQCTYCTSMRRNKDSLICQCRICYLLLPELSRSFQNIENIFSVLRALKFQRIRKKDFHFMTDDLSLCILEPCSFKNSKINFLDSLILDNRNLFISQHILRCLFRSCQRTGKTDIKMNIFQRLTSLFGKFDSLRCQGNIYCPLHLLQFIPLGYPMS